MSKASEMAQVSAKGGFHLMWGLVVSTLIQSIGTILIARFLGADNMGLYAIAIAAPSLIATFRDWGITTAMVKYAAQANTKGDIEGIRNIFVSGILFEVIVALALTIFSFSISGFLAQTFQRPAITGLIQIASFIILTGALVNTATVAFTGMEKMHLNSIVLVIQSIVKTALILCLVLLGLGSLGATIGAVASTIVGAAIGILLVYIMYNQLPKPAKTSKLQLTQTLRSMIKYGLPVSIGAIVTGFLVQFYSWILAFFVTDNALIGNYSLAQTFVVLITFFATPVTTMMFPAFSKLDHKKDSATLKNVFQYSVKYAALIVLPVTFMIMALAQPAVGTLFQDQYVHTPLYLALLAIPYLFAAFGSLSAPNLINGQGQTKYSLKLTLITVAIGFPLSYLLTSTFGITGLIVATISISIPSLLLSLNYIKKNYDVSIDWIASAKILLSSGLAGLITYLAVAQLPFISIIQLIIGAIVYIIAFLFLAIVTRTINRTDLANIKEVANVLGPLRKPVLLLISVIEKTMTTLRL